jgi:hypothetical protein
LQRSAAETLAREEEGSGRTSSRDVTARRWPLRRRFLVIAAAAALCWAIPAAIVYLLLAR